MPEEKPQKCPKCAGQTLYHNKGISQKNGKPYENYKCKCGFLQWVDIKPKGGFEQALSPRPEPSAERVESTVLLADEVALLRKELTEKIDELLKYLKESMGE